MLFGIGKVLSISESNKDKFQFDEGDYDYEN